MKLPEYPKLDQNRKIYENELFHKAEKHFFEKNQNYKFFFQSPKDQAENFGDLLNYSGDSARLNAARSRAEIFNPQTSPWHIFDQDQARSIVSTPTLHAVIRFAPTSKVPILITRENGIEFRCSKTYSNKDLVWFHCSKRQRTKCSYFMRVKMVLTQDPSEDIFWELANWDIEKASKIHTCHLFQDIPKKSLSSIMYQK